MTKDEFLKGISNDNNHRLLLWFALEMTKTPGGRVVEFGSGHGSTPYLREYCKSNDREFHSYDNNPTWAQATGATLIENWEFVNEVNADVLLIDHAPGERRKVDIAKYKNKATILVCHDTEPAADHGYQMRQHFDKFKYVAELKGVNHQGAWATVMSNILDVRKMIGQKYGKYSIRGFESQIDKA